MAEQAYQGEKRGPKFRGLKTVIVHIKCRPEWREWLEQASTESDLSAADFIEQAVASHAKRAKLTPPPERMN